MKSYVQALYEQMIKILCGDIRDIKLSDTLSDLVDFHHYDYLTEEQRTHVNQVIKDALRGK